MRKMVILFSAMAVISACNTDSKYEVPADRPSFCASHCQLRTDLGCDGVPSDPYQSLCEDICLERYEHNPDCEEVLLQLDDCLETGVTYSCGDGTFEIAPADACAVENYACSECTGSARECFM